MNKGDDISVSYRSRLVGEEFADKRVGGLFAATPPLEALRFLVHEAATLEECGTGGVWSQEEKVTMINDFAGAFFEAKAIRKICVELPEERAEFLGGRNVALLNRSLNGTRDAAMNWQEEVAKEMYQWGFSRGHYNPCLYIYTYIYIHMLHAMYRYFYMEMTLQALATERRYSGFERGWKEGSRSRRVSLELVSERLEKQEFSTGSCGSPNVAGNTSPTNDTPK